MPWPELRLISCFANPGTLVPVDYRPYRREDFAALYAIEEACFDPPFRFGRGYMRRLVHRTNAVTWIAEESGGMAGFAIVALARHSDGSKAYIQTLEVIHEKRGYGVGRELLRLLEDSARTVAAVSIGLHVDASNASAIRLYETNGFRNEGREEDFYAPGIAALHYRKLLKI